MACASRILSAIAACCLLAGCADCEIVLRRDHPSPDGRYVATVYGYDCHNTTGHAKHVDLRPAGKKLRHPGNVLSVGPDDAVAVSWLSDTQLVVSYSFAINQPGPASTNIGTVNVVFKESPELRKTPR